VEIVEDTGALMDAHDESYAKLVTENIGIFVRSGAGSCLLRSRLHVIFTHGPRCFRMVGIVGSRDASFSPHSKSPTPNASHEIPLHTLNHLLLSPVPP